MKPGAFAYAALRFDFWLRSVRLWRAERAFAHAGSLASCEIRWYAADMRTWARRLATGWPAVESEADAL